MSMDMVSTYVVDCAIDIFDVNHDCNVDLYDLTLFDEETLNFYKSYKDLKKAGFKFCGPTIVYAWLQACGLINDHLVTCPQYAPCKALAR